MIYHWEKLIPLVLKTVAWFLGLIAIILFSLSVLANFPLPSEIPFSLVLITVSFWLMQVVSSGIIKEWLDITPEILGTSRKAEKSETLAEPVEIARIYYKIDDPEDQGSFDKFLDQPPYPTKKDPEDLISPSQLAENITMRYAQKIEGMYGGIVTVNAEVNRGSLAVSLSFLLNAYTFVAQINDVYESVSLIRRLIRDQLSNIATEYKYQTNRDARIDSNVAVRGQSQVALAQKKVMMTNSEAKERKGEFFPQPVTVTNTITSPPETKDVKVNIGIPSSTRISSLGCFSVLLSVGLILLIFIGVYSYCGFFSTNQECIDIRDTIFRNIVSLLIKIAMYLDGISM